MHRSNLLRCLMTLMTILMIAISLLPASATPGALSGTAEPNEIVQETGNAEKQYFNLSSFRGVEQHNFTAHQETYILNYGAGTVNTSFVLRIAEEANESFNAINFTIKNEEFDSIARYTIGHMNGSTSGFSVTEERQANVTILSVLIPTVTPGNEVKFAFIAHYGSSEFVKQNPGINSTLSFNGIFNHSFYPWVSIPLTNYELYLDISGSVGTSYEGEDVKPEIDPASIEPSAILIGNVTPDSNIIEAMNITSLPTYNLSLLDDSLGYNITALKELEEELEEDIEFIPAYNPLIEENLTLFLSFNYTTNFPPVQYDSFHRTIRIDQWKRLTVTEEITVRNLASNGSEITIGGRIGFFVIPIPNDADYLSGHDSFGNLTVNMLETVYYGEDIVASDLQIAPRIDIQGNDTYKFVISYTQELEDHVDGDILGTQRLKVWSSSLLNWTVHEFSLKVEFPFGASYKRISGLSAESKPYSQSKGIERSGLFKLLQHPYREWTFTNGTYFGSLEIEISYDAGYLWIIVDPLIYSFGILLIGLAYIGVRSIRFGEDVITEIEEIPQEMIENFVKTYEEKTAIRERIQRLERQRRSGKATDREYQKARRILQNKLTTIERDLVDLTRSLAKKGRAYGGFTHSIEVAEAEREDVLTNLDRLEKRKTAGRIGKDSYQRLKRDYERRLKKANNSLDRVLIELRSLIPE